MTKYWTALGLAAALGAATSASAMMQQAPVTGPVTPVAPLPPPPSWRRLPTADELAWLYPSEARMRGQEGQTKMKCKVLKDGALTDCTILQEDPPGQGFGKAILAAARYFKMTPTTPDGKSVEGGLVIIPIDWRLPGSSPNPASADPVGALFPADARAKGVGGVVKMECVVTADGRLSDCMINSECPAGLGFGDATLKSAPYFKMRPQTVDGRPVGGGKVIIPMAWKVAGLEPPAECLTPPTTSKPAVSPATH